MQENLKLRDALQGECPLSRTIKSGPQFGPHLRFTIKKGVQQNR